MSCSPEAESGAHPELVMRLSAGCFVGRPVPAGRLRPSHQLCRLYGEPDVWPACAAALGGVHGPINVFQFDEDTLQRAGLLQTQQSQSVPPFLVVASNTVNQVSKRGCLCLGCLRCGAFMLHWFPHVIAAEA